MRCIVVDDDETIRDVLVSMLDNMHRATIAFSEPSSAVTWVWNHPGAIQMAIVEYMLPAINGRKCIELLKAADPGVACVLCSGSINGSDIADQTGAFLKKPFLYKELHRAIESALSLHGYTP